MTENTSSSAAGPVGSAAPGAPERVPRRLRADAQRNIGSLLAAAKAVFGTSGVDAPAKEIADLAGVGVGTLYRHFPQRSDLVKAVLQHEIDACADAAPHWPQRTSQERHSRTGSTGTPSSSRPNEDWPPPFTRATLRSTPCPATSTSDSNPPWARCSTPRQRPVKSVPTSAPETCCAPSPCCARPYRTRESRTASAWSPSSSTDCATPPNFSDPPNQGVSLCGGTKIPVQRFRCPQRRGESRSARPGMNDQRSPVRC